MLFYVNTLFVTPLQHWNTLPKGFRFPLSLSLLLPVDSPQNSLILCVLCVGEYVVCVCECVHVCCVCACVCARAFSASVWGGDKQVIHAT